MFEILVDTGNAKQYSFNLPRTRRNHTLCSYCSITTWDPGRWSPASLTNLNGIRASNPYRDRDQQYPKEKKAQLAVFLHRLHVFLSCRSCVLGSQGQKDALERPWAFRVGIGYPETLGVAWGALAVFFGRVATLAYACGMCCYIHLRVALFWCLEFLRFGDPY